MTCSKVPQAVSRTQVCCSEDKASVHGTTTLKTELNSAPSEWDTDFRQCHPAVSRLASQIRHPLPTSLTKTFEYSHPPPPPITAYVHCFHPPGTELPSRRSNICCWKQHVEAHWSFLLLAVKMSIKHSMSQPQRTEEQHGFNSFLKATPLWDWLFLQPQSVQGRISPETISKWTGTSNFVWNTCRYKKIIQIISCVFLL